VNTVDVYELIRQSDLVITKDSTAGLEAAIMKKPIVVVNTTKRPDLVPYVEKGVALGAYKTGDIRDRISEALKDEGFSIDTNIIDLAEPIRSLGIYEIQVRLHPEITAKFKLWVVRK
jgi:ribosomal protein L9